MARYYQIERYNEQTTDWKPIGKPTRDVDKALEGYNKPLLVTDGTVMRVVSTKGKKGSVTSVVAHRGVPPQIWSGKGR
jgi:hypothetical protein